MTDSVLLRQAEPDDLPQLLRLEAQFPGDRLAPRQLRFHLKKIDGRLRVIADGSKILGYSLALRRSGSRIARLYSLVIDQQLRGSGFGGRLLRDAEATAQIAGADVIRLEVRADNAAAIALYRRAGYYDIGQRWRYYDDGADALRLEKSLGA
jgi:ribosomal protein S18 acetylase RimI-like enzyme